MYVLSVNGDTLLLILCSGMLSLAGESAWTGRSRNEKKHGRRHLGFSLELYRLQHENGLYFLHEHPLNAASWEHEGVKELLTLPDAVKIKSHMCAFGMRDEDHAGGGLVKKPTGFMTNAIKIADILSQDCSGDHRHVVLIGGGRARRAQVYPNELCRQIIVGLKDQMMHDGRLGKGLIGAVDRIDEGFKLNAADYEGVEFYDETSGKMLPKDLTIKARAAEKTQVYAPKLYDKVPIKECYAGTGEGPVGTKWLEINKGDEEHFNISARLVAQEFTKGKLEAIFAATPPLEAKKAVISGHGRNWLR